jgi:peptidoglycan hydrolase CwlO-like protein
MRTSSERRDRRRAAARPAPAAALTAAVAVLVAAAVFCAVSASLSATAAPAAATGKAGSFTVEKVEPKAPSLQDMQKEAATVRREMQRLQGEMRAVLRDYEATRAVLDGLNAQLVQTRLDLTRTQGQLEMQRTLLAERVSAMYKTGDATLLDVFVSSSSFSDLQSGLSFFQRIMEQDRRSESELEQLARQVERYAADLDGQRAQALEAEATIADQRADMEQKIAERRQLLERLVTRIEELVAPGLPAALAAAPPGGYNQLTWARALLLGMALPVTPSNVAAVTAWEMAEGGHWYNSAHYNPLNTTQPMPGATSMNSVGVKAYTSWQQGFAATVKTLRNGYYDGILAALQRGDDAFAVADAVAASPWGTGDFGRLL